MIVFCLCDCVVWLGHCMFGLCYRFREYSNQSYRSSSGARCLSGECTSSVTLLYSLWSVFVNWKRVDHCGFKIYGELWWQGLHLEVFLSEYKTFVKGNCAGLLVIDNRVEMCTTSCIEYESILKIVREVFTQAGPPFYSSIYTLWRDAFRSSASSPVKARGGSDDIGSKTNIISRCLRSNFRRHAMCKERTTTFLKVQMLRSEEHTSELQSHVRISYAVFCLKKKKKINITFSLDNYYPFLSP